MTITPGKEKKLSYFRQAQQEFKKVSWTTKEELIAYTKIVVSATLLLSFSIYIVDLLVRGSLSTLGWIARMITG
ncbi:MAG: preprotein translocase subunit SecE [Chlamydiota bacterium]